MENDPKDKVVVITGGARGIGYEIADQFLINGAKTVIILDLNEAVGIKSAFTLNAKHGKGKAVFIKCDITRDLDKISSEIFQKYEVDVLINNAGIIDEFSIRKTVEIDCIALVEWSMKFWEHWRTDKGGRGGTIYNVASIYSYEFDPFTVFYKTAKHAVLGFTRSLGHPFNYEKTGVRVIAICPGFTDTVMLSVKIWDIHREASDKNVSEMKVQSPETVGKAAVEIFKVAKTGDAWVAANDKPIHLAPMC